MEFFSLQQIGFKAWIFIVFHGKKIFVGIPRLCIRN